MARTASRSTLFGFLNIAKPEGITAHDVVAIVRKTIGVKQVGHGGTLDPMATGVLPIAVGKATRLLRFLEDDKTYLAEIRLGLRTTTDDITGETLGSSDRLPDLEAVRIALAGFSGLQKQIPPLYSAIHVGGERLYDLARQGRAPDTVPEREVTVHSVELISYQAPFITTRISCSAGTYIRSIARDLGSQLECGGCLSALVREQAGSFRLPQAVTLEQLKATAQAGNLPALMVAPQSIIKLDSHQVNEAQTRQLTMGQSVTLDTGSQEPLADGYVLALNGGNLIAVCRRLTDQAGALVKIQPEVVMADGTKPNS